MNAAEKQEQALAIVKSLGLPRAQQNTRAPRSAFWPCATDAGQGVEPGSGSLYGYNAHHGLGKRALWR